MLSALLIRSAKVVFSGCPIIVGGSTIEATVAAESLRISKDARAAGLGIGD